MYVRKKLKKIKLCRIQ